MSVTLQQNIPSSTSSMIVTVAVLALILTTLASDGIAVSSTVNVSLTSGIKSFLTLSVEPQTVVPVVAPEVNVNRSFTSVKSVGAIMG